jgi:hypothetical protein
MAGTIRALYILGFVCNNNMETLVPDLKSTESPRSARLTDEMDGKSTKSSEESSIPR